VHVWALCLLTVGQLKPIEIPSPFPISGIVVDQAGKPIAGADDYPSSQYDIEVVCALEQYTRMLRLAKRAKAAEPLEKRAKAIRAKKSEVLLNRIERNDELMHPYSRREAILKSLVTPTVRHQRALIGADALLVLASLVSECGVDTRSVAEGLH
jgi:hypothetical protein